MSDALTADRLAEELGRFRFDESSEARLQDGLEAVLRERGVPFVYGSAQVRDPVSLGTYLRENGLMIRRTRADVGRELPSLSKVHQTIECDLSVLEAAEDSASELARVILGGTSSFEERGLAARELDTKLRQATGIAKAPFVGEFVRMIADLRRRAA